ncbi:Uncharacterised protein [Klebsiella pneumoniae]|nr:Uncharacterised protein [Klebsiella pneumoniae]
MKAYGQRLFSRRGLLHLLLCGRNQLAVGDKRDQQSGGPK